MFPLSMVFVYTYSDCESPIANVFFKSGPIFIRNSIHPVARLFHLAANSFLVGFIFFFWQEFKFQIFLTIPVEEHRLSRKKNEKLSSPD
jgi:hypothetical protein